MVGVGGLTIAFAEIERIVAFVRARTAAPVVLGGGITSCESELVMSTVRPDYMVVGEGEVIFSELLAALGAGQGADAVTGRLVLAGRGPGLHRARARPSRRSTSWPTPTWTCSGWSRTSTSSPSSASPTTRPCWLGRPPHPHHRQPLLPLPLHVLLPRRHGGLQTPLHRERGRAHRGLPGSLRRALLHDLRRAVLGQQEADRRVLRAGQAPGHHLVLPAARRPARPGPAPADEGRRLHPHLLRLREREQPRPRQHAEEDQRRPDRRARWR